MRIIFEKETINILEADSDLLVWFWKYTESPRNTEEMKEYLFLSQTEPDKLRKILKY